MSVQAITGLTGASKTYHFMTQVCVPALREGRHVITNIAGIDSVYISGLYDIPLSQVEKCLMVIEKEDIKNFWDLPLYAEWGHKHYEGKDFEHIKINIPKNSVIGLDEVHLVYGTGNYSATYLKIFSDVVTLQRKLGLDIYFITQKVVKLNLKLRELVQMTHFLTACALYGTGKESYYHKQYNQDHEQIETSQLGDTKKIKREARGYLIYRSREDGVIDTKPSVNIWLSNKKLKIFVLLFIIILFFSVKNLFKYKRVKKEIDHPTITQPQQNNSLDKRINNSNLFPTQTFRQTENNEVCTFNPPRSLFISGYPKNDNKIEGK